MYLPWGWRCSASLIIILWRVLFFTPARFVSQWGTKLQVPVAASCVCHSSFGNCGYFAAGLPPSVPSLSFRYRGVVCRLRYRRSRPPGRVWCVCSLLSGFLFHHTRFCFHIRCDGGRRCGKSVGVDIIMSHSSVRVHHFPAGGCGCVCNNGCIRGVSCVLPLRPSYSTRGTCLVPIPCLVTALIRGLEL